MTTLTAWDPFQVAWRFICHSNRGSQYINTHYTERLAEAGLEPSIGSVGDSRDCEKVCAVRGI